ncbi:hypothetical protein D3C85_1759560 [compost metagenome]
MDEMDIEREPQFLISPKNAKNAENQTNSVLWFPLEIITADFDEIVHLRSLSMLG